MNQSTVLYALGSYRVCNCDDFPFADCQLIVSRFSSKVIHNPSLQGADRKAEVTNVQQTQNPDNL